VDLIINKGQACLLLSYVFTEENFQTYLHPKIFFNERLKEFFETYPDAKLGIARHEFFETDPTYFGRKHDYLYACIPILNWEEILQIKEIFESKNIDYHLRYSSDDFEYARKKIFSIYEEDVGQGSLGWLGEYRADGLKTGLILFSGNVTEMREALDAIRNSKEAQQQTKEE
jgi:hypothetical protein